MRNKSVYTELEPVHPHWWTLSFSVFHRLWLTGSLQPSCLWYICVSKSCRGFIQEHVWRMNIALSVGNAALATADSGRHAAGCLPASPATAPRRCIFRGGHTRWQPPLYGHVLSMPLTPADFHNSTFPLSPFPPVVLCSPAKLVMLMASLFNSRSLRVLQLVSKLPDSSFPRSRRGSSWFQ